MGDFFTASISEADPLISAAIDDEVRRQADGLIGGSKIGGDVFLLNDGDAFARQGHFLFGKGIDVLEFGQARQARPFASG